jgi:Flp pilus assembly pilin Flp
MKKYFGKEDGQGVVEYGLIIGLIAVIAIASLGLLGTGIASKYDSFADIISSEELADGSYRITTEDGVYILSAQGRLMGPFSGTETSIIIPNSMSGFSLKEIYQDVFKGKNLTSVIFDGGSQLVRIHARAFQNNKLTSVTLPDTLQRIDLWAFKGNNLTEITIPPNVNTIEQKAFDGNDIKKITIGSKVSSIGEGVFSNNSAGFKTAYAAGGAGTYIYTNGNWVKQ